MYKEGLPLENQQWLVCHQSNQTKPNQTILMEYKCTKRIWHFINYNS